MNDFPKLGINTEELRSTVEALIEEAQGLKDHSFGAVNWGDLGVVDIEYRLSMLRPDDGPQCVVQIEEAAPDCGLTQWIWDRLDKVKFPKTYIECEW